MRNHSFFLTLNIFSATGGIEKVCRIAGKALYENSLQKQERLMIWSMHDKDGAATGNHYFPTEIYKCFGAKKAGFVKEAVLQGSKSKLVILSHINLLMIGWMIKKISPSTRIILMAHGIEIWGQVSKGKSFMLPMVSEFWAVSRYTRDRIHQSHGIPTAKIQVLNNCLDPFLPLPKNIVVPPGLKERYGIKEGEKIIFTLTRLSSKEKYKGYDDVIAALSGMKGTAVKYVIGGKGDQKELAALKERIASAGLEKQVILAGFIPDEELAAHFKMSDCYVMPSSKEGFGIVFIEAMYYEIPVIGGNADGTMDALKNGELGAVVKPGDIEAIKNAVLKIMADKQLYIPDSDKLKKNFSYDMYKDKIGHLLSV